MGANISKRYFSYKSKPKVFKLVLNCPPNRPYKTTFMIFWNFEFPSFNDFFFETFKFTMVAYGQIKNLHYLETSDLRAKLSEIWDSRVVLQHI